MGTYRFITPTHTTVACTYIKHLTSTLQHHAHAGELVKQETEWDENLGELLFDSVAALVMTMCAVASTKALHGTKLITLD